MTSSNSNACVVLDSNVWLSTFLLNTPPGAAFLFTIRRLERLIVLPEVVESEVVKNTVERADEAIRSIRKGYDTLLAIMGERDDYRVPSEEEIVTRVQGRLVQLDDLLLRVPLTLEHARGALRRVQEESPPNGSKNQQFKDSVIWETVLELANSNVVDLVSQDGGFFENRVFSKGLSMNLRRECDERRISVRLFPDLRSYLNSLREEVPGYNTLRVAQILNESILPELTVYADLKEIEIGTLFEQGLAANLTERLNTLAITFEFTYEASDKELSMGQQNSTDRVKVVGSTYFNYVLEELSDIRLEEVGYYRSNGEYVPSKSQRTIFASGSLLFGRGTVSHKFREPLDS